MNKDIQTQDEISLKELIQRTRQWIIYIFSKWKILLIFLIAGGLLGFFYARSKKTLYRAESTFVLDEGKGSSGTLSNLAFLGLDVGNASAGLFTTTKNIIWLYKSKLMLQQTLTTVVDYKGKKELLINIFMQENGIRKQLDEVAATRKISFDNSKPYDSMSVEQNSIILSCIGLLKGETYLDVSETNKAENLITVSFKSKDEQFSKIFIETLVNNVNNYYIKTKTGKTSQEIAILKQKTDSTRALLNSEMYKVASLVEAVPYADPNKVTLRVAPERKKIDVDAVKVMYIELAKNLETRRMVLAQETPLIQIVDSPSYPLEVIQASSSRFAVIGGFVFLVLGCMVLVLLKWYKNIMSS